MKDDLLDRLAIRQNIDNWMVWRDGRDWDRFATLWHPEGRMHTTWSQTSANEFIARSRKAFEAGLTIVHTVNGVGVDIEGGRAVSRSRMTIVQRAEVHGVLVDVICYALFWDAWERLEGAWLLRLRQPIYELDHMIPVDAPALPELDRELWSSFPVGYRNLAYLQTLQGLDVARAMPGMRGPARDELEKRGRSWLAGEPPEILAWMD